MHLAAADLANQITYVPVIESHLYPSFLPADTPAVSLQTCTPHDHSSLKYSVQDILQIILKGRKNWKTLKGQSEAVWPPYLEAIMLKALQEYEPDNSRETRMLGRYPMRNRFISDYIHSITGKYRSAKQVGSRLQQLRDTPEGRNLIDVLTRCYRTRRDASTCNARQPTTWDSSTTPPVSTISCDSSSTSSSEPPATPPSPIMRPFPAPKPRQSAESRTPVYIDIVPQPSPPSSTAHSPPSTSTASFSSSDPSSSDTTRHIRNIDPTVTFVSPSRVSGKSSYVVLLDQAPVHAEDTTLDYVGPYFTSSTGRSSGNGPVLYNTPLVPKYWDVICQAPDPTLYSIVQDVYHVPDPVPNQDYARRPRPVLIFSATYHFRYSPADPVPAYGQPPVGTSSNAPTMTSAFGDQTPQVALPMGSTTTTSLSVPSVSTFPTSGSLRTPAEVDQNLFDEPFMLDVNFDFEEIPFDDFVASMDNQNPFFM